jgi:hypothetical protein
MDPELEEYLRQVESGQMSPSLFETVTGVSYELAQGHFAGKNTPTDGTDYSPNWRDKMYNMQSRRWSQDEPNDMGIDYTQSADYSPNWRDKMYGTRRGMRKGLNNQTQAPTEDRESYIERRQMESSTGGGGLTSSYEDLAKEYDDMQTGSKAKTGRGGDGYLDYLSYTPMDLESNIWATTHAAGAGDKGRTLGGTGLVLSNIARTGFSGFASGQASKNRELESREEATRKMKRFTNDQGGNLDPGSWYGQYGGEKMSPAQRYQDIEAMYNYQEGGEMPPMEQPQEQMSPQEEQQQQGIPEEEMMVIAQQLMQEFQTMEEMQEYLMQQELPPAVVEQILQAVSILAQEGGGAQEPAQPEQMPKSQVMRDTMSGDMSVEMGFRYGGRYPKLR